MFAMTIGILLLIFWLKGGAIVPDSFIGTDDEPYIRLFPLYLSFGFLVCAAYCVGIIPSEQESKERKRKKKATAIANELRELLKDVE